jgi:hypothetical protein
MSFNIEANQFWIDKSLFRCEKLPDLCTYRLFFNFPSTFHNYLFWVEFVSHCERRLERLSRVVHLFKTSACKAWSMSALDHIPSFS